MKKGFTLLEIIVTVAIILVLTFSILSFSVLIDVQRVKSVRSILDFIAFELRSYYLSHGSFPSNIFAFLGDQSYFRDVPIDPYTGVKFTSLGSRLLYDTSNFVLSFYDPSGKLVYSTSFSPGSVLGSTYSLQGKSYGGSKP
ncbi:MAG: type II secretion system protein [Conexivisphaerales archaeon]